MVVIDSFKKLLKMKTIIWEMEYVSIKKLLPIYYHSNIFLILIGIKSRCDNST